MTVLDVALSINGVALFVATFGALVNKQLGWRVVWVALLIINSMIFGYRMAEAWR